MADWREEDMGNDGLKHYSPYQAEKPYTAQEIQEFTVECGKKNIRRELAAIAKRDMEMGISKEAAGIYLTPGIATDMAKQMSRALKVKNPGPLVDYITGLECDPYQMETIINFYEKGIPIEDIAMAMKEKPTACMLQYVLQEVEENLKAPGKELRASMEEEIYGKLEREYNGKLDAQDNVISQQQEENNRKAAEIAGLKAKIETLEADKEGLCRDKENLWRDKEELKKEYAMLQRERDDAAEDLKALRREHGNMVQKIENLQMEIADYQEREETVNARGRAWDTGNNTEDNTENIRKEDTMPDKIYNADITDSHGNKDIVEVEHTAKKDHKRFLSFAGRLSKGKTKSVLLKHIAGAGLDKAQMQQVRKAVEAGLSEHEIISIINSGFAADEMEQAIQIVLAERMYH